MQEDQAGIAWQDARDAEMEELTKQIRHFKTGFDVRDRTWRFRTFPKCFVAKDAVKWLMENRGVSREVAIAIGRELQERGTFDHVTGDHKFKDEYLFFRFLDKKRVVILGGGFAGSSAAQMLEKDFNVTLVDTKSYFQCTPSLPVVLVDPSHAEKISAEHLSYLKRTRVIIARAEEIRSTEVKLNNGETLTFDYLLICTGSRYEPPIKGPCVVNAVSYNEITARYDDLLRAQTVCVLGGGPVGVEVTGEIAQRFPEKKITLITRGDLLERCCKAAHENCFRLLSQFPNVKLLLGERLKGLSGNTILTQSGKTVEADIIYPCLGFVPNTDAMVKHMGESLEPSGLVRVNPSTLQVIGYDNIFALGDINNMVEEKLAQTAEAHAALVVHNLRLMERSRELKKYVIPDKRYIIVSIGKKAIMVHGQKVLTEGVLASKVKGIVEWKIMRRVA